MSLLDVVDEPARADDRDVGGGAAGDVGGEALLEIVPAHILELDVDVGVLGLRNRGHVLEDAHRLVAVVGDDPDLGLGLGHGRADQSARAAAPGQHSPNRGTVVLPVIRPLCRVTA